MHICRSPRGPGSWSWKQVLVLAPGLASCMLRAVPSELEWHCHLHEPPGSQHAGAGGAAAHSLARSLHVVFLVVALRLGHPHCADRVLGGDNLLARLAAELKNVCDGVAAPHWRRGVGGGVGWWMAMRWGEKVREVQ